MPVFLRTHFFGPIFVVQLFLCYFLQVLCLYWSTSSVYGVVQNLVMQQPRVRRALKIPYAEGESKTPISDMIKTAKLKYLKKS